MARVEIARKYKLLSPSILSNLFLYACGVDRFVHRLVIVHFRATYKKSLWTDLGCGKLRIKGKRSVLEKNALYNKKKKVDGNPILTILLKAELEDAQNEVKSAEEKCR